MLDVRNIKTQRPSKSLDYKNLGPFKIIKIHNKTVYELDLPDLMSKLFPVFHPWLLHLDNSNPLLGQVQKPPPPVSVKKDERIKSGQYHAEEILDLKYNGKKIDPATKVKGCLIYKIKYKGYENYNSVPV